MVLSPLSEFELGLFKTKAEELRRKSPSPHTKLYEWPVVLQHLLTQQELGLAGVSYGCLVITSVGSPWFTSEEMLIEDFVMKLHDTGVPSVIPDVLAQMAAARGLRYVAAGDTQTGRMAHNYRRRGFVCIGEQFLLEVSNGLAPQDHWHSGPD